MVDEQRRKWLLGEMKSCLGDERLALVRFLEYLGEYDSRKWFTLESCSSSFAFMTQRLEMPESAAWRRLTTARVARRFPVVLDRLRRGDVHLTGVSMVAKFLDDSNVEDLLAAISGKSKGEIAEIVADLKLVARKASSVRKSRARTSPGQSERTTPLGEGNWKVELHGNAQLKALIDEARELCPQGMDLAEIVQEALTLYVKRRRTRKYGSEQARDGSGRRSTTRPRTRYIPASARRTVFERDGGQCTFVDEAGRRCSERRGLQLDHIVPFCRGGLHSVGNLRLLRSAHNLHEGSRILGAEVMESWRGSTSPGQSA